MERDAGHDLPAHMPAIRAQCLVRPHRVAALKADVMFGMGVSGRHGVRFSGDRFKGYGIHVDIGDRVDQQGDTLGVVGQSGLDGCPHLHFIVVVGDPAWPYSPVPVSLRNVLPRDVALKSHATYAVQ